MSNELTLRRGRAVAAADFGGRCVGATRVPQVRFLNLGLCDPEEALVISLAPHPPVLCKDVIPWELLR
jgi:hypothetical protein